MTFKLSAAESGAVVCSIADQRHDAEFEAPVAAKAINDLSCAIDGLEKSGVGEAFWHQPTGEYRWLFRREGESERVRICVLRSIGTLTGWENVFWSEDDAAPLVRMLRAEIDRFLGPAA
jgi:hypothetical protein